MATTPSITWKKFTSSTHAGSTVVEASLGSTTAGAWSDNKCFAVRVDDNDVYNLRFWLANSNAVVNLASVNLGATGKVWDFKGVVTASIIGQATLFAGSGGTMTTANRLATVYMSSTCAVNSAGVDKNTVTSGFFIGATGLTPNTSVVSNGKTSKPIFVSVKPAAAAASGDYTQFAFQVGYDFA